MASHPFLPHCLISDWRVTSRPSRRREFGFGNSTVGSWRPRSILRRQEERPANRRAIVPRNPLRRRVATRSDDHPVVTIAKKPDPQWGKPRCSKRSRFESVGAKRSETDQPRGEWKSEAPGGTTPPQINRQRAVHVLRPVVRDRCGAYLIVRLAGGAEAFEAEIVADRARELRRGKSAAPRAGLSSTNLK